VLWIAKVSGTASPFFRQPIIARISKPAKKERISQRQSEERNRQRDRPRGHPCADAALPFAFSATPMNELITIACVVFKACLAVRQRAHVR
jgi:hypothetical protein